MSLGGSESEAATAVLTVVAPITLVILITPVSLVHLVSLFSHFIRVALVTCANLLLLSWTYQVYSTAKYFLH